MRRTLSIQLIFFKTQKYQIIYFKVMMKRESYDEKGKTLLKNNIFRGFLSQKTYIFHVNRKSKKDDHYLKVIFKLFFC